MDHVLTDKEVEQLELIKYRFYTPGGWFYNLGDEGKWMLSSEFQGMNGAEDVKSVDIDNERYEFETKVFSIEHDE